MVELIIVTNALAYQCKNINWHNKKFCKISPMLKKFPVLFSLFAWKGTKPIKPFFGENILVGLAISYLRGIYTTVMKWSSLRKG
jgi:hypothetical protein